MIQSSSHAKSVYRLDALFTMSGASSQWAYTNLSEPKSHLGAAVLGNKAYFAGGEDATGPLSKVEIYDVTTGAAT